MLTGHPFAPFSARSQRGAILVTSLLLLLVLTIIAVSVTQMSRMQERMAGNTREINIAFQGAESGLRGAENTVLSFTSRATECASEPCATGGVYAIGVLPSLESQDASFWESTSTSEYVNADMGDELTANVRYVIENAGFVRNSLEVDDLGGREFYQVSSRSTGTGHGDTVVQSTIARAPL